MEERLVDLDELVLRCRNDQARSYISEAVACYRAGAFRSCIVATWVAVVFDILHKLDELALSGDKNAEIRRQAFDEIRRNADINQSLRFENSILEFAKKEFELISPVEYEDLQRLSKDRNRCAHPSMIAYDEIYQPTAELARYHLRNAITHLLQQPPVQGKAAIERLIREVNSQYFPTDIDSAVKSFQQGPLVRPREALVRNFVVVLLKSLLENNVSDPVNARLFAAVEATRRMHRSIVENTFAEKLGDTIRNLTDNNFINAVNFLVHISDTWQYIAIDVRNKIENFVKSVNIATQPELFVILLDFEPLKQIALSALDKASADEIEILTEIQPRAEYLDRALEFYRVASSYNNANRLADGIITYLAPFFKSGHVDRLMTIATENSEVNGSFGLPHILCKIIDANKLPKQKIDELVIRCCVTNTTTFINILDHLQFHHLEILVDKIGDYSIFQRMMEKMRLSAQITEEQFAILMARITQTFMTEQTSKGEELPF
ncbi:MAG: hypothetical protein HZB51_17600 [Chloroflexi bacterium]|nr:hypothetical protein [Chloroflexota bacterium]